MNYHRDNSFGKLKKRPGNMRVYSYLGLQIYVWLVISYFLVVLEFEPITLAIKFEYHPLIAFLSGCILFAFPYALLLYIFKKFKITVHGNEQSYLIVRNLWPRGRVNKWIMIFAICLLNPVSEEAFLRGILVHRIGSDFDAYVYTIVIGVTISVLMHTYQGIAALPFHLCFALAATAISFSSLGCLLYTSPSPRDRG